jgi:hypothetical protein
MSDPWKTFDRRCKREGIATPALLGPLLDAMREAGDRPPCIGYVVQLPNGHRHGGGETLSAGKGPGRVYLQRRYAKQVLNNVQTVWVPDEADYASGYPGYPGHEPNPEATEARVHAVLILDGGDMGFVPEAADV